MLKVTVVKKGRTGTRTRYQSKPKLQVLPYTQTGQRKKLRKGHSTSERLPMGIRKY